MAALTIVLDVQRMRRVHGDGQEDAQARLNAAGVNPGGSAAEGAAPPGNVWVSAGSE